MLKQIVSGKYLFNTFLIKKPWFSKLLRTECRKGQSRIYFGARSRREWWNFDGCTIFRLRVWLIVRKIDKEEESGF
jgi:hypothetical protein